MEWTQTQLTHIRYYHTNAMNEYEYKEKYVFNNRRYNVRFSSYNLTVLH